ncbi:MAG: hypothetical protein AB1351_00775 [Thermoproteota archaeon]
MEGFCARIRSLDNSIRFAGLADYAGKLRASAYRQGLVPLMDRHETERYALQTVFRARTRGEFEPKLGRQKYAVAIYEKVIRVTLTIANPAKEYCNMYLLLSLDMITGFDSVIENKVLPFIREHKAELLERTASFSAEYSRFDKFK